MVAYARESGFYTVFVPADDAWEASLIDGVNIFPVTSLSSPLDHLRGYHSIERYSATFDVREAGLSLRHFNDLTYVKERCPITHNHIYNDLPGYRACHGQCYNTIQTNIYR